MDQDATGYGPRDIMLDGDPAPPQKGAQHPHFSFYNKEVEYILENQRLGVVEEEDLGVTIEKSLKSNRQCAETAATANAVLGMIRRTFLCKDKKINPATL